MGHLPPDARSAPATIVGRRECGIDAFVLELELAEALPDLKPGRFAMLAPLEPNELTVPRPFSVFEQISSTRISFLIQVIGKGTAVLGETPIGEPLLCTGPLGNGFEVAPPTQEVVLVAGGVGSAPFLKYLQLRAEVEGCKSTHFFYGARTLDRLYDHSSFEIPGINVIHATDDGSSGFHGNVVAALDEALSSGKISEQALFCACGPGPMLRGFDSFAREKVLNYELSLETYMGCGIGVCNGCPTATAPNGAFGDWPWAKACVDGPVFRGSDLSQLG